MNNNILLDTDSYKASHFLQYPPNTTQLYSYLESRGGLYSKTLFFGLQYYLKEYFCKPITMDNIEEAKTFYSKHGLPFNYEGFKGIVDKYNGYFPIKIRAVPEGSVIPTHNILMSVESTDPEFFWIVSYLETLLMRLWYPITVATTSWYCKQIIQNYLIETSETGATSIGFKLHDFGSRGVSSKESAAIGGAAHLINFLGSDTVPGIILANEYYNCQMSGFSIPAAEHSSITTWTRENETLAYKNMLDVFGKDGGMVAVVSDSYDIYNAIENIWGKELKAQIIENDTKLIIRPDSGEPVSVVLKCLKLMDKAFGSTMNCKGYKVINQVRLIQGDGIDIDMIRKILETMKSKGYSADNIAFGMGGGLLQKCNRDTQKFAYKCSWARIDNESVNVFKDPITDKGKKSKAGRLDLVKLTNEGYKTVQGESAFGGVMRTVFANGKLLVDESLETIRNRSNSVE